MRSLRPTLWLWLPLGAVVFLSLLWIAWYGAALWWLSRTKIEIRAAGFPATAAEVIPAAAPDTENAAPLLVRVEGIWDKVKDSEGFIKACPGANDPARDPLMFDGAKLANLQAQSQRPEIQEVFRLLAEASRKPVAWFDRDYSKGAMMELGPLVSTLAGAQQLSSKAWMAARQGKEKEVAEDLLVLSRLASFGLRDILLIPWLVGVAVDGLSLRSAQLALAELAAGSFRMEDWKALDESWAANANEARGDLVRALEAERVLFGTWLFEGAMAGRILLGDMVVQTVPVEDPEQAARWRKSMGLYGTVFAPLLAGDYAMYLRHMLAVRDAVKNGATGEVDVGSFADRIPKWAILTRLAAPAYDGIPKKLAEYEVNLRLGRLGLALEDYRARAGKYPASLQELGPPDAATTDPFTGQPFVYRPDGDSVLVYSVGFDRADDGGVSSPGQPRRDVVWHVERAKAALSNRARRDSKATHQE